MFPFGPLILKTVSPLDPHSLIARRNPALVVSLLMHICVTRPQWVNTLRPRQNGRHFPDDIFKLIFLNEIVFISIKISLKFVPSGRINNIPALVHIMAWCGPGDKPLSEPMMVSSLTHICVTRPQWVNQFFPTPYLYHELFHDYSYKIYQHINLHSCKISIWKFLFSLWSLVNY